MELAARDLVRQRAGNRCEYCLLRQEHSDLTHHLEHIVPKQHGGSSPQPWCAELFPIKAGDHTSN